MFDIALSVWACVRSSTRADIALMLDPVPGDDAVAFTPGGGRLGSLMSGAFDGVLADEASRQRARGVLLQHRVSELEAAQSGLPVASSARFLLLPADQLPPAIWPLLLERRPVAMRLRLEGSVVTAIELVSQDDRSGEVASAWDAGRSAVVVGPDEFVLVIVPLTRLVIAGRGEVADALAQQARLLGWKPVSEPSAQGIVGLAASLTPADAIVVIGHDVESSSQCLMAALESDAGYVGALGSTRMQQARADWLAYRDVTDLSRVRGPAGLDIGATSPAEIAVSIAAQILRETRA